MKKYKDLDYTDGNKVICIKETSGQGGSVAIGETGIAVQVFQTSICRNCVDFKRDSDNTCVHGEASAFKKLD